MEKFKLDKEFATKWLAALRSGEYEQGKNFLFKNGKYCCVGVAGAICGISEQLMYDKSFFSNFTFGEKLNTLTIPNILKGSHSNSFVSNLTTMNDGLTSEGTKTFKEIADWVEQNCEII